MGWIVIIFFLIWLYMSVWFIVNGMWIIVVVGIIFMGTLFMIITR